MSTIYINITNDDKLFKQLNYFTPPILLLFFVRSGVSFDLKALVSSSAIGSVPIIVIGVVYFFVRIIGKYAGAYLGSLIVKKDKKVRNYLGLALIPQAGVAIGLAAMGARTIGGEVGAALETIILASSVLYELIGPACAKLSLFLSKSYDPNNKNIVITEQSKENKEHLEAKNKIDDLIKQIKDIQSTLPEHAQNDMSEEEKAFVEASEELFYTADNNNYRRFINKR